MAAKPKWNIRNEGRAWRGDEAWDRYQLTPEKFEMIDGKLLRSRGSRDAACASPENVGADRAVQLGDPSVWRAALAKLPQRR